MKGLIRGILIAICTLPGASYAMPILSPSGVTGLEVDGILYDIAIGDMNGQTAGDTFGGLGLSSSASSELLNVNLALASLLASPQGVTHDFFNGCSSNSQGICNIVLAAALFSFPAIGIPPTYFGGIITRDLFPWTSVPVLPVAATASAESTELTFGLVSRAAAVPTPTTLALFALGFACFGWLRRRSIS